MVQIYGGEISKSQVNASGKASIVGFNFASRIKKLFNTGKTLFADLNLKSLRNELIKIENMMMIKKTAKIAKIKPFHD